jgi:hypothetical protein
LTVVLLVCIGHFYFADEWNLYYFTRLVHQTNSFL